MDSFTMAKIGTEYRISSLAEKIATQQTLVDCLGLANSAGKSAEDALKQRTEYEIATARLTAMRQQLAELVRERDTFGVCL